LIKEYEMTANKKYWFQNSAIIQQNRSDKSKKTIEETGPFILKPTTQIEYLIMK
jgi:hypothetical protein